MRSIALSVNLKAGIAKRWVVKKVVVKEFETSSEQAAQQMMEKEERLILLLNIFLHTAQWSVAKDIVTVPVKQP
jgi:hypothetical protein